MIRILFVCHGNICRSPMAEYVLKQMLKESGMQDKASVSSAAISTEEIWRGRGNPMDERAQRTLRRHGIPFRPGEARQITPRLFAENDKVILMDESNRRGLYALLGKQAREAPPGKVSLLLDHTERPGAVADPWYTGDFEKAWQDIERGCRGLMEEIKKTDREGAKNDVEG